MEFQLQLYTNRHVSQWVSWSYSLTFLLLLRFLLRFLHRLFPLTFSVHAILFPFSDSLYLSLFLCFLYIIPSSSSYPFTASSPFSTCIPVPSRVCPSLAQLTLYKEEPSSLSFPPFPSAGFLVQCKSDFISVYSKHLLSLPLSLLLHFPRSLHLLFVISCVPRDCPSFLFHLSLKLASLSCLVMFLTTS